jgi:hypothetical protein
LSLIMEHVMMMEIHIDVNVQIILWVIDVKEVFKIKIFILFWHKEFIFKHLISGEKLFITSMF